MICAGMLFVALCWLAALLLAAAVWGGEFRWERAAGAGSPEGEKK